MPMTTETQDSISIKQALLAYLRDQTEVAALRDEFVITLPIHTLDKREVAVFVEKRMQDFFVVHDGGKSISELYSQGIHMTDSREMHFALIAHRLGASVEDGVFQIGCKAADLQASILAIAQCATLAMVQTLTHKPLVEDEAVQSRIDRALVQWKAPYSRKIERGVEVQGDRLLHRMDFVAVPLRSARHRTVGIKVLTPTYNPMLQAERYGFFVLDTEHSPANQWARLAVLTKAELWRTSASRLVETLAHKVLLVRTGEEQVLEESTPRLVDELAA